MLLVRRRELEQFLVEEDDREAALVDRFEVLGPLRVGRENVLAGLVENLGFKPRKARRVLD